MSKKVVRNLLGNKFPKVRKELEEEVSVIEKNYEVAKNFAPDYNVEAILQVEENKISVS